MARVSKIVGADRTLRVFLCHSVRDKPTVRNLYRRLKSSGFAPWLDEEELLPGQDWQHEIQAAVRAADVVVICLSRSAVSEAGYVNREIRLALDVAAEKPETATFLVPARLEEVQVPESLRRYQWADLFQEGGYDLIERALRSHAKAIGIGPNITSNEARMEPEARGGLWERVEPACAVEAPRLHRHLQKHHHEIWPRKKESTSMLTGYACIPTRATGATHALSNGAGIAKFQECLGHANVSTTWLYDRRKSKPEDSPTFHVKY